MITLNRLAEWRVAAMIAALISISACGNHKAVQTASAPVPALPPTQAPAEPPETPPVASLDEKLKEELSQLGATHDDLGWVVVLSSAHFKAGQTRFEPSDAARIDGIATLLKERSEVQVLVQAFTDSRGSRIRNQLLSRQRADAVQHALTERGVEPGRIRTEGLGEKQPVASNDTTAGRRENRRVEIVFSDAKGHFAEVERDSRTG